MWKEEVSRIHMEDSQRRLVPIKILYGRRFTMRRRKRIILTGLICFILILIAMAIKGTCALAAEKVIKLPTTVHLPPPPTPPGKAAADVESYVDFAKKVKEATEGRVIIEYFWGSSLGKANDFIRMVGKPGIADAGIIASLYHKWEIPLTAALTIPFLTSNQEAQERSFMELYETWKPLREEWDKVNCEVIWTTISPSHTIGTTTKPIRTLDDLRNMKIWGVAYKAEALNAVGAKVISSPAGEIYEGLSKGVMDGAFFAHSGHHMFGFWEMLKFITNTDFMGGNGNMIWVMNKDVWNQISKDDQKMMKRVGAEMVDQWLANLKAENDRVNEAFVKKGMKFYELPDVDKAKWNELAGVPIEKNWITEMEKRGQGENAREFLKRYRALITKYEPKAKYHFIFPK